MRPLLFMAILLLLGAACANLADLQALVEANSGLDLTIQEWAFLAAMHGFAVNQDGLVSMPEGDYQIQQNGTLEVP